MNNPDRAKRVAFGDESIRKSFEELKSGKFEEKRLAVYIERAISDLKENPLVGVKIPSKLWPIEYVRKFEVNNLRKYDLPNGWRLIYKMNGRKPLSFR